MLRRTPEARRAIKVSVIGLCCCAIILSFSLSTFSCVVHSVIVKMLVLSSTVCLWQERQVSSLQRPRDEVTLSLFSIFCRFWLWLLFSLFLCLSWTSAFSSLCTLHLIAGNLKRKLCTCRYGAPVLCFGCQRRCAFKRQTEEAKVRLFVRSIVPYDRCCCD